MGSVNTPGDWQNKGKNPSQSRLIFDIKRLNFDGGGAVSFKGLRSSRAQQAALLARLVFSAICNSAFYNWLIFTIPSVLMRNDAPMGIIGSSFGIVFLATLDDTSVGFTASGFLMPNSGSSNGGKGRGGAAVNSGGEERTDPLLEPLV